MLSSY
jgi:hypothetical protein